MVVMNTNLVGENIKRLRIAQGWSQYALAERLDLDVSTICRWETGSRAPRTGYVPRVAEVLGVDANTLFAPQPTPNGH